ncbi:hypothetical protein KIPB_007404, partial [Kipferlia bialata]
VSEEQIQDYTERCGIEF